MYLIDTSTVSNLKKPRPHPKVLAWLKTTAATELFISVATVVEIRAGIERAKRSGNPTGAAKIQAWFDSLAFPVKPLLSDAAIIWSLMLESLLRDGGLRVVATKTNWWFDLMIAAIAITEKLVVVTNNVKDFERIDASFKLSGIFDPTA